MKEKIKILMIMPELYHGGAEKQFRNLIVNISKQEFEIMVAIEHSYRSRDLQLEKQFIEENKHVRFICLAHLSSTGNSFKRYCSSIMINAEVFPLLVSFKPDIVVAYTLLGLKVMALSKWLGVKCVFGERNSGVYPEKFYRNQGIFLKSVDVFIANSKSAQRNLDSHHLNTLYIPNGIEKFSLIPEKELSEFSIIVPARIARVKNQELLIKAISTITENLHVCFVGKVEDAEYKILLMQLASDLKVDKQIEYIDYTNNIREIYKNASLIILPSISEGFSNVILECYMYGRLCLVSDIEMNRDVGAPGQRYFNVNDVNDLRNKIIEIIQLPEEVKQIEIMQNHEYATKNYSMNNMTMMYEAVFKKLGGGNS